MNFVKRIFGKHEVVLPELDPPGRTFKRILTSHYFSGQVLHNCDGEDSTKAKQNKINLITEHKLLPMYVRYTYKETKNHSLLEEEHNPDNIISAYVAFQKEIFDEKWNMIHVTELSFVLNRKEFEEFEAMAQVSLENDFRDLTAFNNDSLRNIEYRKEPREIALT